MNIKELISEKAKQIQKPFWEGPESGHITQSLISAYTVCPERFRIKTMLGLAAEEPWNYKFGFGNLWHLLEEHNQGGLAKNWKTLAKEFVRREVAKNPDSQDEIAKTYHCATRLYPHYLRYYQDSEDSKEPIAQEEKFRVRYELPSGRSVILRGMFDSVDYDSNLDNIVLQENKTTSDFDQAKFEKRFRFDIQLMTYLIALRIWISNNDLKCIPVAGSLLNFYSSPTYNVRYNIVRRPLSGGKGTIRKRKATKTKPEETTEQFYTRLEEDYFETMPEHYFMRYELEVPKVDVKDFETKFLSPQLENICDDYEWWRWCMLRNHDPYDYTLRGSKFPKHKRRHIRLPYGIYNPVSEGRMGQIDYYLNGEPNTLVKLETLSPELDS